MVNEDNQEEQKSERPGSRGRKDPLISASLAKVVKKAAQIADLMSSDDIAQDLKVLRDAKKATHQIYDTKAKRLKKVPDHKTRLAATTLSRAYHEGLPVARSITAHGDVKDFPDLLRRLQSSEAAKAIEDSSQKTVEGKEIELRADVYPGDQQASAEENP